MLTQQEFDKAIDLFINARRDLIVSQVTTNPDIFTLGPKLCANAANDSFIEFIQSLYTKYLPNNVQLPKIYLNEVNEYINCVPINIKKIADTLNNDLSGDNTITYSGKYTIHDNYNVKPPEFFEQTQNHHNSLDEDINDKTNCSDSFTFKLLGTGLALLAGGAMLVFTALVPALSAVVAVTLIVAGTCFIVAGVYSLANILCNNDKEYLKEQSTNTSSFALS